MRNIENILILMGFQYVNYNSKEWKNTLRRCVIVNTGYKNKMRLFLLSKSVNKNFKSKYYVLN